MKTANGNPTHTALNQGMVQEIPNGRNDAPFDIWHTEKTVAALEKAGHKGTCPAASPHTCVQDVWRCDGPCALRESGRTHPRWLHRPPQGKFGRDSAIWMQGRVESHEA